MGYGYHGAGVDYALSEILPAIAQDAWKHRDEVRGKIATHGGAAARSVWRSVRNAFASLRGSRGGAEDGRAGEGKRGGGSTEVGACRLELSSLLPFEALKREQR